jgi:ribosomal protein S18 acetylase RimI-like enzyme
VYSLPEHRVCPFQDSDREAVFRIAAETAFFGGPLEAFLDDRRLFWDIFYRYYTDMEPEHGWVACVNGQVVGFLMGCVDTDLRHKRWRAKILPGVAGNILIGHYRIGRLTLRYLFRLAMAGLRKEFAHADLQRYPAHLHINILDGFRGYGLGKALMQAYLEQLRLAKVTGVHLMTTNLNQSALRLYERLGFLLLDSRPTRIWEGFFDTPVENQCYGLKLVE